MLYCVYKRRYKDGVDEYRCEGMRVEDGKGGIVKGSRTGIGEGHSELVGLQSLPCSALAASTRVLVGGCQAYGSHNATAPLRVDRVVPVCSVASRDNKGHTYPILMWILRLIERKKSNGTINDPVVMLMRQEQEDKSIDVIGQQRRKLFCTMISTSKCKQERMGEKGRRKKSGKGRWQRPLYDATPAVPGCY